MPTFLAELNRSAIPLSRALRECFPVGRSGRTPHPSTGFRWVRDGIIAPDGSRIRLEAIRIGGAFFVTPESCEKFIRALNAESGPTKDATSDTDDGDTDAETLQRSRAAGDALKALGC